LSRRHPKQAVRWGQSGASSQPATAIWKRRSTEAGEAIRKIIDTIPPLGVIEDEAGESGRCEALIHQAGTPPRAIEGYMTPEEVSHAHREDFYGALRKNDLEKLSKIYSDDYMLVRPDGSAFTKAQILDDLKVHAMSFN
jgi:hypothetical protein